MAKAGYNHVLLEIFKMPRILGWFPFDRKFRLSEKSICYCFFAAFVVPLIHRSLRLSFLELSYHPVKVSFNRLSMVCNVCSYVFPIFWWIRRRRIVHGFMKTINKLINKCPKVRFRRNRPRCLNLLLAPPILFSCYACKFSEVWYNASRYFFSNISYYYGASFICQFLEVLHVIQYVLRHENKLEDGDKPAISKCFMTLLEVDQAVYSPSIFLLTTQYLIQIISYLFMALIMHPHSSEFFKKKFVFDLLHNIIPLVTMVCSYALVKAQAHQLKEKLVKKMIKGPYGKSLKKNVLELPNDDDSGCGFFNLDNSLIIAVTLSAVPITLYFYTQEEIRSCLINYSYSVFS